MMILVNFGLFCFAQVCSGTAWILNVVARPKSTVWKRWAALGLVLNVVTGCPENGSQAAFDAGSTWTERPPLTIVEGRDGGTEALNFDAGTTQTNDAGTTTTNDAGTTQTSDAGTTTTTSDAGTTTTTNDAGTTTTNDAGTTATNDAGTTATNDAGTTTTTNDAGTTTPTNDAGTTTSTNDAGTTTPTNDAGPPPIAFCSDAQTLTTFPTTVTGTTQGAPSAFNECQHPQAGPERIFKVSVADGDMLTASLSNPDFDSVLIFLTPCTKAASSCLVRRDSGLSGGGENGEYLNNTGSNVEVFIVVDGYLTTSSGSFSLSVDVRAPAVWTCSQSWLDDGECDCGCGTQDTDCANTNNAGTCDWCGACGTAGCGDINPDDTTQCLN